LATAEEPRSWATASRCCGSPTTPRSDFPGPSANSWLPTADPNVFFNVCLIMYPQMISNVSLNVVWSIQFWSFFLGTGLCLCTWEALAVPGRPGPLCSCALWPLLPQWATTAAHWRRSGKVTKSYDVPPRKHWVPPYLDGLERQWPCWNVENHKLFLEREAHWPSTCKYGQKHAKTIIYLCVSSQNWSCWGFASWRRWLRLQMECAVGVALNCPKQGCRTCF
jgi:hypothetical protein